MLLTKLRYINTEVKQLQQTLTYYRYFCSRKNRAMTRRTVLTSAYLLLIPFFPLQAQVLEPVTWSFGSEKTEDNKFDIVMTADIDNGWHLYAMNIAEGGPIATSFTFEEPSGYTMDGKPVAIDKPEVKFDNSFGMDIGMHSVKAEFR